VSATTYFGAAAGLWACAGGMVSFRNLTIMQFANTFAATTTPAGVGGLALSTRFLQKAGLGTVRATAAVAVQQAVQVITHVSLLIFLSVDDWAYSGRSAHSCSCPNYGTGWIPPSGRRSMKSAAILWSWCANPSASR
jgi:hypothetical protein